ncbi:MAG: flagellar hook-length control protein FliK [Pseudomonadota bacterium]
MSQLPITPSAQATKPGSPAAEVSEVSQATESAEQPVAITFEQAMQEAVDTLEIGSQPGLGWTVRIPLEPVPALQALQNGSFMPDQAVAGGKALPLQFGGASSIQPEPIKPLVLTASKQGLLMETQTGQADRTSVAAFLGVTKEGMQHLFDARSGSELTGQTPLTGLQSLASTLPGRPGGVMLPVEIPVGQPGWDKAVGERIQWMMGRNIQNAEMKLTPPNLGPLEIRISVHNDQASVSFITTQAPTREALEAAIPRLREMLGEANLNLADVDVGQRNGSDAPQDQEPERGGYGHSGEHETTILDKTNTTHAGLVSDGLVDDYA